MAHLGYQSFMGLQDKVCRSISIQLHVSGNTQLTRPSEREGSVETDPAHCPTGERTALLCGQEHLRMPEPRLKGSRKGSQAGYEPLTVP